MLFPFEFSHLDPELSSELLMSQKHPGRQGFECKEFI